MNSLQYIRRITDKYKMCERKVWKAEEDQALKQLYEQQCIKKWSQISKKMKDNYGILGRNSKQCRERYHNHLKSGINKDKWSRAEQAKLIQLHVLYGNKWALISKLISGRTQNCVKNMLYSKMRKSIRQLNRFSYCFYRRQLNEIKVGFIYRLIEFTENTYHKEEEERTEQQNISIKIKNQILKVAFIDEIEELTQSQKADMKKLVEDIHQFKRVNHKSRINYNKKTKRILSPDDDLDEDFRIKDRFYREAKDQTPEPIIAQKQRQVKSQNNELNYQIFPKTEAMKNELPQNNGLFFLINHDLENPIQIDNQFCRPGCPNNLEDWAGLTSWPSYHSVHD